MKIYNYNSLTKSGLEKLCQRDCSLSPEITEIVSKIENKVVQDGDKALAKFTEKFDKAKLSNFKVTEDEFVGVDAFVPEDLKQAIKIAKENISKFHKAQVTNRKGPEIETTPGVYCWQEFRAIEKVGLYIPGGGAPLFSTVLMLAIPALIAGCKKIVVSTPPDKDGNINPAILWTTKLLGVTEIYKAGGAQAIFALAHGTEQIPKVDKIFGPGNQYVTAAKLKVANKVAIDMPAGPSEVLIIADKNSNATYIAADLLAQAEHGKNSQVVLVCTCEKKIKEVIAETGLQKKSLPRAVIADNSLQNSFAVLVDDIETAVEFSNYYAPEHLLLEIENHEDYIAMIENAGSVFCGPYSSVSFGDYASGTNHTLPTSGFAKSFSGLSLLDFGKWLTFQKITQQGFNNLGKTVGLMAEHEDLAAHKNSITVRREK